MGCRNGGSCEALATGFKVKLFPVLTPQRKIFPGSESAIQWGDVKPGEGSLGDDGPLRRSLDFAGSWFYDGLLGEYFLLSFHSLRSGGLEHGH
jgi:hypothetical protein